MNKFLLITLLTLTLSGCEMPAEEEYDFSHYDRAKLCKYLTKKLTSRNYTFAEDANEEQQRLIQLYNSNGCDK